MGSTKLYCVVGWFMMVWPSVCFIENDVGQEDPWVLKRRPSTASIIDAGATCGNIKPTMRDLVTRFYAILPYFDKDHLNSGFLHKFRGIVRLMSEDEDPLDREAASYATVITPIVFLQPSRDTWCLLERFHRALRLFQTSHPTDKRHALKLLQNIQPINQKIQNFISDLLGPAERPTRCSTLVDTDEDEIQDKNDIKYLKELIKNLG